MSVAEQVTALLAAIEAAVGTPQPGVEGQRWHWCAAKHARDALAWLAQVPLIEAASSEDPVFAAALVQGARDEAAADLARARFSADMAGLP